MTIIKGVLFDASGTLLRIESALSALRALLDRHGIAAADEEVRACAQRLDAAGAIPGGTPPQVVPAPLAEVWEARDESPAQHRAAFTGLAREVELPWPGLDVGEIYDRSMTADAWRLYPDALEVLGALRERGLRTAVVSNVGFDWRPVFTALGLDPYLDAHVFSYEVGLVKPDPRIFQLACAKLDLAPREVLMVGDERRKDGGAVAAGCRYLPVDHLPVEDRPDGLRPVLAQLD
ncbi:HAD-IA family hydrolase [Streptomyces polyrhachis]|uniref:HAD-IA family hydrolase n=1 Tax=Streptomyces polyrhachis TaxID=1282885 RepID=A0ABW2GF49_9ACTN